jgi:hypothetical protein
MHQEMKPFGRHGLRSYTVDLSTVPINLLQSRVLYLLHVAGAIYVNFIKSHAEMFESAPVLIFTHF